MKHQWVNANNIAIEEVYLENGMIKIERRIPQIGEVVVGMLMGKRLFIGYSTNKYGQCISLEDRHGKAMIVDENSVILGTAVKPGTKRQAPIPE